MGAHPGVMDGVEGTAFAVWAPNARRVSVVGDFNGWDGRRHPMRLHPGAGIWDIFLPGVGAGALYKYEIKTRDGEITPQGGSLCVPGRTAAAHGLRRARLAAPPGPASTRPARRPPRTDFHL